VGNTHMHLAVEV